MFNRLQADHLGKIRKLARKKPLLLVYKGFPVEFLSSLSREILFLNKRSEVFSQNCIDIRKINENTKKFVKNFITGFDGVRMTTYEEFIRTAENIHVSMFDGDIVIVKNSIFQEFPNQTGLRFCDIEEDVVEKQKVAQNQELFQLFYADSIRRAGVNFLRYRDVLFEKEYQIKTIDFWDYVSNKNSLPTISTEDEGLEEKVEILFNAAEDDNYALLKAKVFDGTLKESEVTIRMDESSFRSDDNKRELSLLQYLFGKNNRRLRVVLRCDHEEIAARKDFQKILEKHWKSSMFRELSFYENPHIDKRKQEITQDILIEEIVRQVERSRSKNGSIFRDLIITAPTGAGKSLLFQIPAIYIAKQYDLLTVVVSPLKALMYDQVSSLRRRGVENAAFINSDISLIDREKVIVGVKNGTISILYLSPELLLSHSIESFVGDRKIGLLVVDEAHLVTTWGRDFRPDYWYLGTYIHRIRRYTEYSFPVVALTATAVYSGPDDMAFETVDGLRLQNVAFYIGNVRRDDIVFQFTPFSYQGNYNLEKVSRTIEVISINVEQQKKTIVYFPWVRQITELYEGLPDEIREKVGVYYGSADKTEKNSAIEKFNRGEVLIILATKAFGMGVDIGDIEVVYHFAPSGSLTDYLQEIGRAARDQNVKGVSEIDFSKHDLRFSRILFGLSAIRQYQLRLVLRKIFDLYSLKKKQNLLVSPDDFAFIFGADAKGLENKLKSAFMLIEKDLLRRHAYNVVLIRPKNIFTTVFMCIASDSETAFLNKYGEYCEQIASVKRNQMGSVEVVRTHDLGNIYAIELDKLWETYFSNEGFPTVKWRFFSGNLFEGFEGKIWPRYRLSVHLHIPPSVAAQRVRTTFAQLEIALDIFEGRFFSLNDFRRVLRGHVGNDLLARRIEEMVLSMFVSRYEPNMENSISQHAFLQRRRVSAGEQYRVVQSALIRTKFLFEKNIRIMFPNEDGKFERYVGLDNDKNAMMRTAYLLDSLSLGSYEVAGGDYPQVFIRINDPFKVKYLAGAGEGYENGILSEIHARHRRSMKIMENFFLSDTNDTEKWDLIEDYFLGGEALFSE